MSAGQIQKPGTTKDAATEAKASVVAPQTADEQADADEGDETQAAQTDAPKKKTLPEKLDKVQKMKKGIKLTPIQVSATDLGFYGNQRRKVGDKFQLDDVTDFSEKWMKKI